MNSKNVHISDVGSMKDISRGLHTIRTPLYTSQYTLPLLLMTGNFKAGAETHADSTVIPYNTGIITFIVKPNETKDSIKIYFRGAKRIYDAALGNIRAKHSV